jgi:hypothetical protein
MKSVTVLFAVGLGLSGCHKATPHATAFASAGATSASGGEGGSAIVGAGGRGGAATGGAGNASGAGGASSAGQGGSAGSAAGGAASTALFGKADVVSTAAKSCSAPDSPTPTAVIPANLSNAVYGVMGAVSDRRFAFAPDSSTLLTFSRTGALSSELTQVAGAASDGTTLAVVFADGQRVVLQHYDAALAPVGASVDLAKGTVDGVAGAASASGTFVSWVAGDQVVGRVFSERGVAKFTFSVGSDSRHCQAKALAAGTSFLLAWACGATQTELRLATISQTGTVQGPSLVTTTTEQLDLIDFRALGSGYVALLHDLERSTAYLLRTNDSALQGSIRAISGVEQAFGLAVSSKGMALAGLLGSGTTALGRVSSDASLAVDSAWTCLDLPSPGGHAALDVDTDGYAALVRFANGSAWLVNAPF